MEDQKIKPVKESVTLRDQFAMAALTGLLSYSYDGPAYAAEQAYIFADAMLKERKFNPQ